MTTEQIIARTVDAVFIGLPMYAQWMGWLDWPWWIFCAMIVLLSYAKRKTEARAVRDSPPAPPTGKLSEEDEAAVLGALDSLALALVGHSHQWTDGERAIYERACAILGKPCIEDMEVPPDAAS